MQCATSSILGIPDVVQAIIDFSDDPERLPWLVRRVEGFGCSM